MPRVSPTVGRVQIVPEDVFADGVAAGRKTRAKDLEKRTIKALSHPVLKNNLGAMSRQALAEYVKGRLETPPNYTQFPELEDIYPERVDYLRGFAQGAGVTLAQAAVLDYVEYRKGIDSFWAGYNPPPASDVRPPEQSHCSGVLLVGPEGVLGAHSAESSAPPKPRGYRERAPRPYRGLKQLKAKHPDLKLKRPRTGYIESWGVGNEHGVGCFAGTSCWCWLDEPIEDVWPIKSVPLLRFARNVRQVEELWRRYNLFNWTGSSSVWADVSGDGMIVEKSFRRIAVRRLEGASVLWCTEGHFQTDQMSSYIRGKRLEYVKRMGKHLGAEDLQYAHDGAVRFTHMGELCHMPWGRGYEHMRRILTDHAPFPRAVCRHVGPDTDPVDRTPTMASGFQDITHNRSLYRHWVPWKKFCCEMPEEVAQFPPRPFG